MSNDTNICIFFFTYLVKQFYVGIIHYENSCVSSVLHKTFISEPKLDHLKSAVEKVSTPITDNQASLTPSPVAQAKPTAEKSNPDLTKNSNENHHTKEESSPPSPRQQIDLNESSVQHSLDEFEAETPGKSCSWICFNGKYIVMRQMWQIFHVLCEKVFCVMKIIYCLFEVLLQIIHKCT